MKKIVVLISGNGSNLQAIIEKCHNKEGMRIVAVISNKEGAYGLLRAQKAGIPTWEILSKGVVNRDDYDEQLSACIDKDAPDLIVLAGFMRILTPHFVRHYKGKLLNIHPSLLPKYPGLHTHQRALEAKEKEHGASVHFVTEELDAGPVILQAKVPILQTDNAELLAARVQEQEHKIYPQAVHLFFQGKILLSSENKSE